MIFLGAYLTGSVLTQGFSPSKSAVNVLIVGRELPVDVLTKVAKALPPQDKAIRVEPLLLHEQQIKSSLDVFPMEWLDIQERHLRLEGRERLQRPSGSPQPAATAVRA